MRLHDRKFTSSHSNILDDRKLLSGGEGVKETDENQILIAIIEIIKIQIENPNLSDD